MPFTFTALAAIHFLAASSSSKKTTTSSSSAIFLIFLVLIVGVYFLFIAPQRRRMRQQMNQQPNFQVGDEVVTKSGIYGRVRRHDGERVSLEIASGTVIEVMQSSIARRVEAAPPTEDLLGDPGGPIGDGAPGEGHESGTGSGTGWTEPAHEGWGEPAAPAATGSEDQQAGGPS